MQDERRILTGWGRTSHARTRAVSPASEAEVAGALAAPAGRLIAFGGGRSYGDAALNDGGDTLLTGALNRILSVDEASGVLVCEPGVTFRELIDRFLDRGWVAPVSPGTAFATIGGAVANDVHGKNHDRAGSFGDHVLWLDLLAPDGRLLRLSSRENVELFRATIGGIGLTGVILKIAFAMKRVSSSFVTVREARAGNLDALMAALRAARAQSTYTVAWIDATATGRSLGRGILEAAEHAEAGFPARPARRALRLPVDFPDFALNPLSIGLFNQLYYRRVPAAGRARTLPFDAFLYPLDALLDWNRMYGRRGFYQFQCVIPEAEADRGIRALLETIAASRSASFLAVLKTLGSAGRGFLSFPFPGFTLALDFPARAKTPELMARLERLTLDHGGRVYLAKDACLSSEGFRRMYPQLPHYEAVLHEIDPMGRLRSDMARRLRIGDA
ncbi:FAD-binding oxidoreductase [Mangrovibrevibacter kandeliae]|uniref:FAD-binding oxidoreductase n=1 Tax=Mangrovibrevibacter kandeliae TaxID=2968473 RepID=UPI002117C3D3|nr:FAD-binding oxidoreductase [Aurantimonas sp. CSK15Z-1]MCQ8784089.1 FAD-binding oxidoreductase [Aurantimonas sp. CSK15Z-1]